MKYKFAQTLRVRYRWPDMSSAESSEGIIIYTNIDDETTAADICQLKDDDILIYTDNIDTEYIRKNFDGLIINITDRGTVRLWLTPEEFFEFRKLTTDINEAN